MYSKRVVNRAGERLRGCSGGMGPLLRFSPFERPTAFDTVCTSALEIRTLEGRLKVRAAFPDAAVVLKPQHRVGSPVRHARHLARRLNQVPVQAAHAEPAACVRRGAWTGEEQWSHACQSPKRRSL